jgi:hypothetical protein
MRSRVGLATCLWSLSKRGFLEGRRVGPLFSDRISHAACHHLSRRLLRQLAHVWLRSLCLA